MKTVKVIISGGGTGGHIFPAIAIGKALQRLSNSVDLLYVGAIGKMEMEKIPQEGFKIVGLAIAGWNRAHWYKNLFLPYKLFKSMWEANKIIKDFKPDIVIGVGGYASFPIMRAAQNRGIPTLLQEQNSFAGKSNKILGKRANFICVAYENMNRFFPAKKIVLTGNPVRNTIAQSNFNRTEGQNWLGLNAAKKTLLIVGGSLGAKTINETIAKNLEVLIQQDIQLIWQTGKLYFEQAQKISEKYKSNIKVFDFIKEMDKAYAAADMIISRAGALAIAELTIVGKPVIFVPYPFAAEDHQTANALALVNQQAALMINDEVAFRELIPQTLALINNSEQQNAMKVKLSKLAIKNADEKIAEKIFETINQNRG